MRLTDFLLARIAEDEAVALSAGGGHHHMHSASYEGAWTSPGTRDNCDVYGGECSAYHPPDEEEWFPLVDRYDPARVLAECEAKRQIVEWHKSWPVLVETQPQFERADADSPSLVSFKMTQQIAWLTQQEYRARFGDDPPTAPILLMLALPYAGHPDYDEAWRR